MRGSPGATLPASALVLAAALAALACGPRTIKETVFEQDHTEVLLRHQAKGGKPVPRGFDHPTVIAPVRMAHILSRIDLRTIPEDGLLAGLKLGGRDKPERRPAIPTEALYVVAEGVSKALERATRDQEVVVLSLRREKRFGLFDREYLTSFVTYVKDGLLYVHLARSHWQVPEGRDRKLPQPEVGEQVMRFRLLPSEAMTLVDSQSVAVAWRDPIFRRPTRTEIRPGGRVVRREILMESPPEEAAVGDAPAPTPGNPLPADLSPDTLRELADLEESRRNGEITETEYRVRRREILDGQP